MHLYGGLQDYLHKSAALDPRFKSLLHLDAAFWLRVYDALTTEIVSIEQQGQATDTTGADTSVETETADRVISITSRRKTAMAELFGELFTTQETGTK
ncbi:hypothetical protein AAFF_G00366210 [Aldrovandia affinis]|uniref:Uncharacterized protein n=1 Tax=Aldrovandia affinis TaxID=143900 RepID=A0AAD7WMU5_9TELE|nr:hypothetical protein AAFF_G00366210 [Aldrovandia affinis]